MSFVDRDPPAARRRSSNSRGNRHSSRSKITKAREPVKNEFLACPHCGCRYKGKSSFTTHLRKKHPDQMKEVVCYVCHTELEEKDFDRHFRVHQQQDMNDAQGCLLQCDFCEFSCYLNVDMIQHTGSEHDGDNVFSIARTEAQFLMKTRNNKRKVSENDSERTLSGSEAFETECEEVLEETVVPMEGTIVVEPDSRADLMSCLKRGQNDLMEHGYADVMLHHLLISSYERSWMKLLVAWDSKYVRIPIDVSCLAVDHNQLTNFAIENEIPNSLRKLFLADAWAHLESIVGSKRALYFCSVCRTVRNTKVVECVACKRRYHQSCNAKTPSEAKYQCSSCFL